MAITIDALAQEIRRVDGRHSLGAGALAEALMPFITKHCVHQNAGRSEIEVSHANCNVPGWEYRTTTGQRKAWEAADTPPEGEGWERNLEEGRRGWERFDYHEESYWRRKKMVGDAGFEPATPAV